MREKAELSSVFPNKTKEVMKLCINPGPHERRTMCLIGACVRTQLTNTGAYLESETKCIMLVGAQMVPVKFI